jgi:hypothetical protein
VIGLRYSWSSPSYVGSISELNDLVTNLNETFDNCTTSSWAEEHLCSP